MPSLRRIFGTADAAAFVLDVCEMTFDGLVMLLVKLLEAGWFKLKS
jgi:hypothetical protein